MGMIRRIIFVLGALPLLLHCFLAWIATGKDQTPLLTAFEKWAAK